MEIIILAITIAFLFGLMVGAIIEENSADKAGDWLVKIGLIVIIFILGGQFL